MTTKTPREVIARFGLGNGRTIGLERARGIEHFLTSAGYTVERDWQPIETAPKDREILVGVFRPEFGDRVIVNAIWSDRGGRYGHGGWNGWGDAWGHPQPSHWRPLPAPPADKDSGEKVSG